VLKELRLEPAIAFRRALQAGVLVCASSLLLYARLWADVSVVVRLYLEQGVAAFPSHLRTLSDFRLTMAWLGIVIVGAAIVGLCCAVFRLIARQHVVAGTLLELGVAMVIVCVVILRVGLGLYTAFELGLMRPLSLGIGVALCALQVSAVYAFAYPRNDAAAPATVAAVLQGSGGKGTEHVVQHAVLWAVVIYGLITLGVFSPFDVLTKLIVWHAFMLAVVAWCALVPGLVACAREDTHRVFRHARPRRRAQRYSWYVLTTSHGWSRLRPRFAWLIVLGLGLWGAWAMPPFAPAVALSGVLLAHVFIVRAGLTALADGLPADAAARIEESGVYTLYLRSFEDDDFQLDLTARGWRRFVFLPPTGSWYMDSVRSTRLEELVVTTLWRHRPVLAVKSVIGLGDPLGAVHVTLAHADWQREVDRMARHARTVVTVLAVTAGLRWEASLLMADTDLRRRATFVVPPGEPPDIVARWRNCFGELAPDDETTVARALVAKPLADDVVVALTAARRTAAAYRMALEVADVLVARDSAAVNDTGTLAWQRQ
jgi:hypothetical protein